MRLPAKTARWKRCVPRLALINVWISKCFYLHSLQLSGDAERRRVEVLLKRRLGLGHKPIDGLLPSHQLDHPLFHDATQRRAGIVIKDAEVALLEGGDFFEQVWRQ